MDAVVAFVLVFVLSGTLWGRETEEYFVWYIYKMHLTAAAHACPQVSTACNHKYKSEAMLLLNVARECPSPFACRRLSRADRVHWATNL